MTKGRSRGKLKCVPAFFGSTNAAREDVCREWVRRNVGGVQDLSGRPALHRSDSEYWSQLSVFRAFSAAVAAMLLVSGAAYASPGNPNAVPEASAFVLAPLGLVAIVAAERRRRRLAKIQRGVGKAYFIVKRAIDLTLASTALLLAAPFFALIAAFIRLDSEGPVLFKRRVIGMHGRDFDMYKFRSMVQGAEVILQSDEALREQYYGDKAKIENDPRVTRAGKFLRRTSLDEMPQLINILLGHMTFVGPRPIAADEIPMYGEAFEDFKTVKPGITGIWQTCGRSETSYQKRVEMDMLYIKNRSILLDLWIIVTTVPAVVAKRGAY